jgi:hypothetical protein
MKSTIQESVTMNPNTPDNTPAPSVVTYAEYGTAEFGTAELGTNGTANNTAATEK